MTYNISEQEYELFQIWKLNPGTKFCEGLNCTYRKEHEKKKWSWSRFFIGLAEMATSREFIVFVIYTLMIRLGVVLLVHESIAYGLVAVCFMFHGSISNALYNAKVAAEFKAGANISKEIRSLL